MPVPSSLPLLLVCVSGACALDNQLAAKPAGSLDPAAADSGHGDDGADTSAAEVCNGADDDGDGAVDEGFADADGDGVADCVEDSGCPDLAVPAAAACDVDPACAATPISHTPVVNPWEVETAWTLTSIEDDPTAVDGPTMPALAPLLDRNGDGAYSIADGLDIVVSASGLRRNYVTALAADGEVLWTYSGGAEIFSSVAVADVTGDATPEVLFLNSDGFPAALDATGRLLWTASAAPRFHTQGEVGTVVDLDGDGAAEVLFDNVLVRGADGSLVARFAFPDECQPRLATVADADMDGEQEVYACGARWSAAGVKQWDIGGFAAWVAVIQTDLDAEGELLFVGSDGQVVENDGTMINVFPIADHPGPPCVGDFDGDTEPELIVPVHTELLAFELDGSAMWTSSMEEQTAGMAACSGADLDGDGALEVLLADEERFVIHDGRTGDELFSYTPHRSTTAFEYPTVGDLDGDGTSEVVMTHQYSPDGVLTVLRHAGAGWAPTATAWSTHDLGQAELDGALHVATPETPRWLNGAALRTVPTPTTPGIADLTVDVAEVCCDDDAAHFVLVVTNQGGSWAPAEAVLTMSSLEGVELARSTLPAIPSGVALAGIEVEAPAFAVSAGVRVEVFPSSGADECDESDNAVLYLDVNCP